MNCDICRRTHGADLSFNCVGCARGQIYQARLEGAALLLEKEYLVKQVEQVTQPAHKMVAKRSDTAENTDGAYLADVWRASVCGVLASDSSVLTQDARSDYKSLHDEVSKLREEVVKKRQALRQKREALEQITSHTSGRRQKHTSKLIETTDRGRRSFDSLHQKDVDAKSSLCREAALLMRLEQKKRRRGGVIETIYSISGLPIFDLRNIAGLKCAEISAVLSSIVQLLSLASFYLSVRLPAEVNLRTHDVPAPMISTPGSSYLHWNLEQSGKPSPATGDSQHSTGQSRSYSRPRPLSIKTDDIEMPVARWAKKDPAAFNFLLEGISLLAWDIAWLCRSQGLSSGTETWEDVCDIGGNLHQLLLSPPHSPAIMRVLPSRDAHSRNRSGSSPAKTVEAGPRADQYTGHWSHSSTHSFLGSAGAQELLRTWKLGNYTVVVDSLRRTLWAEMSNAEWELLQEPEWDDGGEQFDEAVFVGSRAINGFDIGDSRSIMTAHSVHQQKPEDTSTTKGTSGWTKVKSRDNAP